jgi:hypothetical protein
MNRQRYESFRSISQIMSSDLFNALEREIVVDAAEGLLLTDSPDSFELGELHANVEAALTGLLAGRRIDAKTAAYLRKGIRDCGPPEAAESLIAA